MRFDQYNFDEQIKENLATAGFKRPTDIQFKSIPAILKGEDVLAIAQTGTGKTAAFAIPVLHMIRQKKRKTAEHIRCIVMVPTHELAMQITTVFNQLGKHTKVKALALYGGVEQAPQIARLDNGIDILVATPGRMFDLISQGYLRVDMVEMLILDEADHMLKLGFLKDIRDLVNKLPRQRQTLFFSATIDEEIKKLAYSLVKNAIRIQISPKDPVSKNVEHSVAFVEMDDKRYFLERMINENPESKILVFVRTKVRAERVAKAMERASIKTLTMHSDKEQKERDQVMSQFRSGECKVLIATDINARGLDIPDVDYVVNYDLPDVPENYVHRVGRTGRGTKKGLAVSFCSPEEKPTLAEIETYLTNPIKVLEIDTADYSDTIDFSNEVNTNWKALMKQAELDQSTQASKKKKKKK